jgi:hypothetical protein
VLNPLFRAQNAALDPRVPATFWIVGEDAETWTDPLSTPSLTHVFLAASPTQGSARFSVFRWQNGVRHRDIDSYQPGDPIGRARDPIDFRSNWTLVDIRKYMGNDRFYVVLMAPDGRVIERDFETDKNDADYLRFEGEAASANGRTTGGIAAVR